MNKYRDSYMDRINEKKWLIWQFLWINISSFNRFWEWIVFIYYENNWYKWQYYTYEFIERLLNDLVEYE